MASAEESILYWRNQVSFLLKAGAATVLLFAGWAIEHHGDFDLTGDADHCLAAIGLLVMSSIFAFFLPLAVGMIYAFGIRSSKEPTLIPVIPALVMSAGLSSGFVSIAIMMSIR